MYVFLLSYVKTINELTTYTYLVEFLAFGAMLCAMLFLLIIVSTRVSFIKFSNNFSEYFRLKQWAKW